MQTKENPPFNDDLTLKIIKVKNQIYKVRRLCSKMTQHNAWADEDNDFLFPGGVS